MWSKVKSCHILYGARIFYRPLAEHVLITELSILLCDTAEWPRCPPIRQYARFPPAWIADDKRSFCFIAARMQVDDPNAKRNFSHASPAVCIVFLPVASMNEIKSFLKAVPREARPSDDFASRKPTACAPRALGMFPVFIPGKKDEVSECDVFCINWLRITVKHLIL